MDLPRHGVSFEFATKALKFWVDDQGWVISPAGEAHMREEWLRLTSTFRGWPATDETLQHAEWQWRLYLRALVDRRDLYRGITRYSGA
jgi:hypothetical protein